MAYTPTAWETGDIVTAEKLNKIEDGVFDANDYFIVILFPTAEDFSGTMSKSPEEIREAYDSNIRIMFVIDGIGAHVYPTQFMTISDNSIICVSSVLYTIDGVGDVLIKIQTDASDAIYSTTIYPLTPLP